MFGFLRRRKNWITLALAITLAYVLFGPVDIQTSFEGNSGQQTLSIGHPVVTVGTKAYAAGIADYSCDGTDDNVQFQAALDSLPVGGGRLVILAGSYSFSTDVSRNIPYVTIEGVGGATDLERVGGILPVFTVGAAAPGWVFRDITTNAGGIDISAAVGWSMENVHLGGTYYTYRSSAGQAVFDTTTVASLTDSGLTGGRVPIVGIGGLLEDTANLVFSGGSNTLTTYNLTVSEMLDIPDSPSVQKLMIGSSVPFYANADIVYIEKSLADQLMVELRNTYNGASPAGAQISVINNVGYTGGLGISNTGWGILADGVSANETYVASFGGSGANLCLLTQNAGTHIRLSIDETEVVRIDNKGLSIGAYGLKTTNLMLKEGGSSIWYLRNSVDTVYTNLQLNSIYPLIGITAVADAMSINTNNVDCQYIVYRARDSGVGLVEVARQVGAADPYFAFGGSQEFKFYYSGNASFGGNIGVGVMPPTAVLHLKAGTTIANTAPLKFTQGALLSTNETGAVEFDGTYFYVTDNSSVRHKLAYSP